MTREEYLEFYVLKKELDNLIQKEFRTLDEKWRNISKFCIKEVYLNKNFKKLSANVQKQLRGYACEIYMDTLLKYYTKKVKKLYNLDFKYLNNLILPTVDRDGNKSTTQLDNILLMEDRIICIECKSMFGKLFIRDGQINAVSNKSNLTISPWKQNVRHILAVKDILKENNIEVPFIVNVVFMFGIAKIEELSLNKNEYLMIPTSSLKTLEYLRQTSDITSRNYNMKNIYNILSRYIPIPEDELDHINNVIKPREE